MEPACPRLWIHRLLSGLIFSATNKKVNSRFVGQGAKKDYIFLKNLVLLFLLVNVIIEIAS